MKKIVSLLLALVMLCSLPAFALAASFSDFAADHWAYSYVDTLVADGTINGFEDGTFRPAGTVTRAEFVKMIGKGTERRTVDFSDVPSSHWAYEYIMASGLEGIEENVFEPSTSITRGDVAVLLWKRAGSPKGITAPPSVHRQSKNYDAVSWVYTTGIMTGDDNLNLRLGETLTRAEAAALIVRSRQVNATAYKTNFYTAVSPEVYAMAYNSFDLVDKAYDPEAKLTNGELSMAAARIISGTHSPTYPGVSATVSFEHPYAQSINMVCRYIFGESNDNAAFADKNAVVSDAVCVLMFAALRSALSPITYDANGATYTDVTDGTDEVSKYLKYAYQNGIGFTSDGTLGGNKEITLKEFASLLIQFDGFAGFNTASVIGANSYSKAYKLNTNLYGQPSNASDYAVVLADIPTVVYEKPFLNASELPKESFAVTDQFVKAFETLYTQWVNVCASKGRKIVVTVNPALSVKTNTGYTFRVKVKVADKGNASVLSDIINCADSQTGSKQLVNGEEFFVDIDTFKPFNTVVFDLAYAKAVQIVY